MPKPEKKGDYHVDPYLSHLTNEPNTKNDGQKSFSYESKESMSFIPTRRMSLWCPIMKRKEITT